MIERGHKSPQPASTPSGRIRSLRWATKCPDRRSIGRQHVSVPPMCNRNVQQAGDHGRSAWMWRLEDLSRDMNLQIFRNVSHLHLMHFLPKSRKTTGINPANSPEIIWCSRGPNHRQACLGPQIPTVDQWPFWPRKELLLQTAILRLWGGYSIWEINSELRVCCSTSCLSHLSGTRSCPASTRLY